MRFFYAEEGSIESKVLHENKNRKLQIYVSCLAANNEKRLQPEIVSIFICTISSLFTVQQDSCRVYLGNPGNLLLANGTVDSIMTTAD